MTDELPLSPEAWATVVQNAIDETGHSDEVIVATESTMTGWRVFLTPVRQVASVEPPVAGS